MEDITKKKIGQQLNNALAKKDVKQKDLAKILGVSDNTISYFCSGARVPNTEQLIKISKALDVSTDYLLGLTPNTTTDPDLKFVCDYTGLSENTILMLKESVYNENAFSSLDTFSEYVYNLHKMVNLMFSDEHFIMLFCSNFINYLDEKANKERFYYIYSQGNIPLGLDFTNLYLIGMQQSLKKFKDDYIEKENLKKQNLEGTHNANNN